MLLPARLASFYLRCKGKTGTRRTLKFQMIEDSQAFAVILAAGSSTRMGREKAGLPWLNGQPLLLWMVEALSEVGWDARVVLGPTQFECWVPLLPAGCAVLNPHPEHGKTTSLIAGVTAVPHTAKHILVTAVDQPRPPAVYSGLLEAARSCKQTILVPDREGHRGHPVVFPGFFREQLLSTNEDTAGLRGILARHEVEKLQGFDPEALGWDLNTPFDYEGALAYFQRTKKASSPGR